MQDKSKLANSVIKKMFLKDSFSKSLGIKIIENAEGYSKVSIKLKKNHLNGHGVIHGGIIFTLADTAFANACNSRNRVTLAQNCNITFLKPVTENSTLTATAFEQESSGRTAVYDVKINDEANNLIALFRGISRQIKGTII